jgi:EpsD family peptidyl-prolyl cis-trans isomerase
MLSRPAFATVIALSVLTSGCSKQATGQTVAVVNGEEISASELNAELAAANIPQGADKKKVLPQLLQRIIDRRVMVQRAQEQGLDKSPDFLTRQRRANDELLISMLSQRQSDSMKVPTPQEVDAFIAANPGMFAQRSILLLDQLQFDAPKDQAGLQRLSKDQSLEALATSLSDMGIQFARGKSRVDTATIPTEVMRQIEAVPRGEPFIIPASGKLVASVITGREASSTSADQNRKLAVDALRRQNLNRNLQDQLKQSRAQAEIKYQPGYEPPAASKATPKK